MDFIACFLFTYHPK